MQGQVGRCIVERREAMGWRQEDVAAKVGVNRSAIAQWERGIEKVPQNRLEALAVAVGLESQELTRCWEADARTGIFQPRYRWRALQPYPVSGTLDEMLAMRGASEVRRRAALSPDLEKEVLDAFPRDSPLELLAVYQFFGQKSRLELSSPLAHGCRRLVTERDDYHRYAGDRLRHMLRMPSSLGDVLIFPQVTLAAIGHGVTYRLDFFVRVRSRWVDLEMDGKDSHEGRQGRDRFRAKGLGLPRFGYEFATIVRFDFVSRFLRDLQFRLGLQSC